MIKKFVILVFVLAFLVAPTVLAEAEIDVKKLPSNNVVIKNTEEPARFLIEVTNTGEGGEFEFYTYAGSIVSPEESISLKENEKKNITIEIKGLQEQIEKGNLAFSYYIKRKATREKTEVESVVRVIELKDAFKITTGQVYPTDESLDIFFKNKFNYKFGELYIKMSSPFFELNEQFSLAPYEEKKFSVGLNKNDSDNLLAGFYTIDTQIKFDNQSASSETPIKFAEKEIVKTTKEDKGFFIDKDIVKKTNQGNVVAMASITAQENIISRLFTTFNTYPDNIEREGGKVTFIWNKELGPGESFEVETKTNWFYPLIIILLVVGIVYFFKKVTTKDLELRKKIRFVKTKGGEFGLKVSIMVTSNEHLDNVRIKDKLPALAKIHETFSGEKPSVIDQKKRKIEWNFGKLEAGERRMVSYVIYSKIGVLGRFALPPAAGFYEKEGEEHESHSNRAYFVAEQARKESQ